ncbi:hypothetical protein CCP4SC76_2340001 [Gammaproteobacteria bacterium]
MTKAPTLPSLGQLLDRAAKLPPLEQLLLQLKALFVPDLPRNALVIAMRATGTTRGSDTKAWTLQSLEEILGRLVSLGLLEKNFFCPVMLQHPLAVEIFSTPDYPLKPRHSVRSMA